MKTAALILFDGQQPGWIYFAVLGGLAIIISLLWLLNRAIMHFFPSTRDYRACVGNALTRVEAQFLPGREYIMEAREREDADEDEEGEPPEAGQHKLAGECDRRK